MVTPKSKVCSRPRYKILVSACLTGVNCTYKGKNNLVESIRREAEREKALAICPEVFGGLPTPRENSEIVGGDGYDVLKKTARVLTVSGKDVTKNYVRGAMLSLRLAKKYGIRRAILKSMSPACGFGHIYDGTFRKTPRKGDGVLAALLLISGIEIRPSGK